MFFVKRVVRVVKNSEPHICVVDAIVLGTQRAQDVAVRKRKVYRSDRQNERTWAEKREFSSVGSGRYQGKPVTFFDGEPFLFTVESSIREAAENHIRLYVTCQSPVTHLPTLLSSKRRPELRQYDVALRLCFQNFAQLPDVQGDLSHYEWAMKNNPLKKEIENMMAEFGFSELRHEEDSRSQQLKHYAAHAMPSKGDYLPVNVVLGRRSSCGVVLLQSDREDGKVAAKLWLSGGQVNINPGLPLYRHVRWKDVESRDVKLQVAEVTTSR